MPLTLVRSEDNHTLWKGCADAFLDELGGAAGPAAFPSYLWIRNRGQRDLLLEAAEARGLGGWLAPPFTFLGDLPRSFDIGGRTVGLLTRRRLVSRIAQTHARTHGIVGPDHGSGVVRGHMLDRLIGELLPGGIHPDQLAAALEQVATDEFARQRNGWVVDVYRDYLAELAARDLYDFRQTNALLAERVDAGKLRAALGQAKRLHVYGLHTPRDRVRLLQALHAQRDVDVRVYVLAEREAGSEWDELGFPAETLRAQARRQRVVQPAPNPRRELGWVAQQVKETLIEGDVEPHEIAVVARMGREDVRRAYDALRDVGVDATARIRTPLAEVPVLRTIMELFQGVAEGWSYRALRSVLASPYFDLEVDLRWVDFIAANRRPLTLADWERELAALTELMRAHEAAGGAEDERHRELRDVRVPSDRLASDRAVLAKLREKLDPIAGSRSEGEWVAVALELAEHGWFEMRKRVCRVPEERYDIVRLDQRGLLHLEDLLREWSKLDLDRAPLDAREWHTLFRRLLQSHEIALSTPLQKGVQVLEAHDAALMPFQRVYILHANDGVFPATPLGSGVITDAERVRLRAGGLPLDDHERELRRERTLWRAVAAVPHVEASYRTTDPSGTPLLPSLMTFELLHEIEHAEELPRSFDPLGDPLSPSQAHHAATLELATAVALDPGTVVRVRTFDPHVLRHAVLCAFGEQERGARGRKYADGAAPPGPWNGELRHPQVLARLAEKFGDTKIWSASQLQLYGRSPFLFLLSRVLYLQEIDEAEEDTTALIKGSIAHEVLQLFYQSYIGGPRPQALTGETLQRLRNIVARVVDDRVARGEWLGTPVLWQVRRVAIQKQLEEFLTWELAGFVGDEAPLLCEYDFEAKGGPVEIEHLDAQNRPRRIKLRGRIDRIDRATTIGGQVWRVVDYKSGDPPEPRHFRRGVALQTPLYMKALATKEGVTVDVGRYRSLKDLKKRERPIDWGSDEFEKALRTAVSIPERVRHGLFELALAHGENWAPWDPGIEIRRGSATLAVESRYEPAEARLV